MLYYVSKFDFQGQGLSKILETEALQKTLAKHSGVQTLSWTAVNHSATQKAVITDPSKTIYLTWVCTSTLDLTQLKKPISHE